MKNLSILLLVYLYSSCLFGQENQVTFYPFYEPKQSIVDYSFNGDTLTLVVESWDWIAGYGQGIACAVYGCTSSHKIYSRKKYDIYIGDGREILISVTPGQHKKISKSVISEEWIYELDSINK